MEANMEEKIRALHLVQAEGSNIPRVFELVWNHSQVVFEFSIQLCDHYEQHAGRSVDRALIRIGAFVHDIGVYRCYKEGLPYPTHGYWGGEILAKEGFPLTIVNFALNHLGVGLTAQDVRDQQLGIPEVDYVPETPEQEIVAYADAFHSKRPGFNTYKDVEAMLRRFGESKVATLVTFKEKYGVPNFLFLEERYGSWHEEMSSFLRNLKLQQARV